MTSEKRPREAVGSSPIKRPGTWVIDHPELLYAAFDREGRQCVTTSYNGTIYVWDTARERSRHYLKGHGGWVFMADISAGGRSLVSSANDYTMRLWDLQAETCSHVFNHVSPAVLSARFDSSGSRIVTVMHGYGVQHNQVSVWDTRSRTCAQSFLHRGVATAAFDADGGRIVTAGGDRNVMVWELRTQTLQQTLDGHSSCVRSASFDASGRRVVSASMDNTVKLWDAALGMWVCRQTLNGHTDCVRSAQFDAAGSRVISSSADCTARVWRVDTGACLKMFKHRGELNAAGFDAGARRVIVAQDDGPAIVCDA